MKILHFVHDQFFMPGLISTFKYLGTKSRFVCLYKGMPSREWINEANGIEFVEIDSVGYKNLIRDISYDVVWIHPLMPEYVRFVNQLNDRRVIVVWSSWGGDLYSLLNNRLLGCRTTFKWCRTVPLSKVVKAFIRHLLTGIGLRKLTWNSGYRQFIRRVDFFSMIVENEGTLARKFLPHSARQITFHYTNLNIKDKVDRNLFVKSSQNIWVGNSATFINNYFDLFPVLSQYKDYNIYAPLSYGPDGKLVDEEGRRSFGDRWHPYFDFVRMAEYKRRMSNCSIFIFGHFRQGAVGNIMIALKMGGCVFLSHKNPVYQFLLDKDILVYTLDDLRNRFKAVISEFESRRKLNIKRASELWSKQMQEYDLRHTLGVLKDEATRRKHNHEQEDFDCLR